MLIVFEVQYLYRLKKPRRCNIQELVQKHLMIFWSRKSKCNQRPMKLSFTGSIKSSFVSLEVETTQNSLFELFFCALKSIKKIKVGQSRVELHKRNHKKPIHPIVDSFCFSSHFLSSFLFYQTFFWFYIYI